jgi:hypothetical protein
MNAWTLEGLGSVALLGRDCRRAEANMKEALSLFSLLGDKGSCVFMLGRLALAARAAGRDARAARLLAASAALREAALGLESARRDDPAGTANASARYRARFPDEWACGLAMTLDDAIAYALRGGSGGGARRPDRTGPPRAR